MSKKINGFDFKTKITTELVQPELDLATQEEKIQQILARFDSVRASLKQSRVRLEELIKIAAKLPSARTSLGDFCQSQREEGDGQNLVENLACMLAGILGSEPPVALRKFFLVAEALAVAATTLGSSSAAEAEDCLDCDEVAKAIGK